MTTPSSFSGLVLWLRGDLGITLDGSSKVQNWADQSGNGNDASQSTAADRPANSGVFGSGLCVSFTGNPIRLSLPNFMTSGAKTIVVVRAITSLPGSNIKYSILDLFDGSSLSSRVLYCGTNANSNPNLALAADFTSGGIDLVGANYTLDTAPHVDFVDYNGGTNTSTGSYDEYLDGTSQVIAGPATGAFAGAVSAAIGGSSSSIAAKVDVAEIIVYNRQLTSTERNALSGYLQTQWGITMAGATFATVVNAAGATANKRVGAGLVTVATAATGTRPSARQGTGTVSRADQILSKAGAHATAQVGVAVVTVKTQATGTRPTSRAGAPTVTVKTQATGSQPSAHVGAAAATAGAKASGTGTHPSAQTGAASIRADAILSKAGVHATAQAGISVEIVKTQATGAHPSARTGAASIVAGVTLSKAGATATARPGISVEFLSTQAAGEVAGARPGIASVSASALAPGTGHTASVQPGASLVTVATSATGQRANARQGTGTVSRADAILSMAGAHASVQVGVASVSTGGSVTVNCTGARPGARTGIVAASAGAMALGVGARPGARGGAAGLSADAILACLGARAAARPGVGTGGPPPPQGVVIHNTFQASGPDGATETI